MVSRRCVAVFALTVFAVAATAVLSEDNNVANERGPKGLCMVINAAGQPDSANKTCQACQLQCLSLSASMCAAMTFEEDTVNRTDVSAFRCGEEGRYSIDLCAPTAANGDSLEGSLRTCRECTDRCKSFGSTCATAVWAGEAIPFAELDTFPCPPGPSPIIPSPTIPPSPYVPPSPMPTSPPVPSPKAPSPVPLAFSSPLPRPVNCSEPVDSGLCNAFEPRFFYNATSGMCEYFVWGGCGGNSNRFNTIQRCDRVCADPEMPTCRSMCTLEYDPVCSKATQETYGNLCAAKCAGFGNPNSHTKGECPPAPGPAP